MGGPSVPWRLVEPYEAQASANHDQSLERLHARGGLAPGELWCIVHGKRWREQPDETVALAWLDQWLADDGRSQDQATIATLKAALRESLNRWEWFAQRFRDRIGGLAAADEYDYPRIRELRKLAEES